MSIFSFITLLGGLAFFLYGMNTMSGGLEKLAGGKLEQLLRKMTDNPFKSLLLGAGITIAIQSSSAMTVMLVGLVNSGIMQLGQTVGVIMGSNIGTTLTAWILSLAGIESNNFFIQMLKPESFSPIIALIGILFVMSSKNDRRRNTGSIMVGFAILMFGMELMKDALSPLAEMPEFSSILTAFSNPILGVLVGALVTGVIQSSAASVGILQALALTGSITYGMAIPIIMGQNIGTCVTALLSSIGVNTNAKRVAVIHISFNILGTLIFLSLFYLLHAVFDFAFVDSSIGAVGIAFCHTIFNVLCTALLLPFSKHLVNFSQRVIKDEKNEVTDKQLFLDERLLKMPSVAIAECNNLSHQMAEITKEAVNNSLVLLSKYDEKKKNDIIEAEGIIDVYEDKLGSYLVKFNKMDLSEADSHIISRLLHTIGDFERLGDHALNLANSAQEIKDKDITFSPAAKHELSVITAALEEIIDITFNAYAANDCILARKVEPLEQVIDSLAADIKMNHINRLQDGICTIQLGFVLSDLITNFKRISDHCSNIAVALIELEQDSFSTHEYLHSVKTADAGEFKELYNEYKNKYSLK